MLRMCKKVGCNNHVPRYFVDDHGKKHNCQRRKFCLECSPYGRHNTVDINKKFSKGYGKGICPICKGYSQKGNSKCFSCYFNEKQKEKSKKIYAIIGYKCWYCGYDMGEKGQSILDFHHIAPENKLFNITTREFVGKKWECVISELKKCVSLCCRCHREYHAGLISEEKIKQIYDDKWAEINKNEYKQTLIRNPNIVIKNGLIDDGLRYAKCPVCNNKFVEKELGQKYCSSKCFHLDLRKVKNRPSNDELLQQIKNFGYKKVGKIYGVSDNAVRKWINK